jgi:hypothetical protein
MPPHLHPVDKRHDGPDSRHHASLSSESDISFGQVSLIAWPLKAAAEDARGYAGVRRRAPESEAKRVNEPSTTPTGDQTLRGAFWTLLSPKRMISAVSSFPTP